LLYRFFIRPLLFQMDAERAHHAGLFLLRALTAPPGIRALMRRLFTPSSDRLRCTVMGQTWATPVGLAAGLDKDGRAAPALAGLGFGAIEMGTITAEAQPGNPKPRLFRLIADRAIINRFGFNNPGAAVAASTLARHRMPCPLGGNIGKSKVTPLAEASDDYRRSVAALGPHVDYLVVNVSSPNTPGLRDLQQIDSLLPLLVEVQSAIGALGRPVPLALKVAPDLVDDDLDAIADLAVDLQLDALIATNTTIARGGLSTPPETVTTIGAGGLSGAPLNERARTVTEHLARRLAGRVPLISVGGIDSGDEAYARIRLGAVAVQIYTSFIYLGPGSAKTIAARLDALLERDGFACVSDAVGVDL
jgi:dihydroorotate dehydrogenase